MCVDKFKYKVFNSYKYNLFNVDLDTCNLFSEFG